MMEKDTGRVVLPTKCRKRPRSRSASAGTTRFSSISYATFAAIGLIVVSNHPGLGFDLRNHKSNHNRNCIQYAPSPSISSRSLLLRWTKHRLFASSSSSSSQVVVEEEEEETDTSTSAEDSELNDRATFLPPWLRITRNEESSDHLQEELQWLRWELLKRKGWTTAEVEDLLQAMWASFSGNLEWMLGCLNMIETLLKFEELVTPQILLAGILHYLECVAARQEGVYPAVEEQVLLLREGDKRDDSTIQKHRLALPPSSSSLSSSVAQENIKNLQAMETSESVRQSNGKLKPRLHSKPLSTNLASTTPVGASSFSNPITPEILGISKGASQIKRAEIVAELVLPRKVDYEQIQKLLVSVSGHDWRALAIRCVASLYRLEGILRYADPDHHRLAPCLAAARSALYVYAPMAQRLGLHALKTHLESKAFGILYPRQYKAALSLFDRQGDSMHAVSRYLQHQISHLLGQDPTLSNVDVTVAARVKEPFSFWKKLLRKSSGDDESKSKGRSMVMRFDSEFTHRELLSILEVRDGVALRVIVGSSSHEGKRMEERHGHEQKLCYHIHQLIRAVYPETHHSRVKDYIQNPKPNGYQSLHHTSVIRYKNLEIPFEVQVRSLEMHRIAEFGVAAHWDYKQQQKIEMHDHGEPSSVISLLPALPPAGSLSSNQPPSIIQKSAENVPMDASQERQVCITSSQPHTSPYLEALEDARRSLVESSVFLFLAGSSMEHGQLVSVQKGQLIRDIVKQHVSDMESDIDGWQVWRNGRLASLDESAQNGDVIVFEPHEEHSLLVDGGMSYRTVISA